MRDCLLRGEAPYASHAMYTQPGVLDDGDPADREHGIKSGFAWREVADATVIYIDLGISKGMEYGIAAAEKLHTSYEQYAAGNHQIEYRQLGEDWEANAIAHEQTFKTRWP